MSENQHVKKKGGRRGGCFRWLVLVPLLLIALAVCGASVLFVIIAECSRDLPNVEKLKYYSPSETTRIFSANGELLATLFKENREWVKIEDMPQELLNAVVASEDAQFYSHNGLSYRGIARAIMVDVKHRSMSQGASTITQQLAREIFLHPRTSLRRKVREALLAIQIEKKFTKREILELYLNQVYFGAGAYGVQSASKTYFGKKVSDLSLAECAILIGVLPAPSSYSPFVDPKMARDRQILVLMRMYEVGCIDYPSMKQAIDEKLTYSKQKNVYRILKYPYFTTYALHELFQKYSDDLIYRGGLNVYTTVDLNMQKSAEKAVKDGIYRAETQGLNCHQAAMVAIEPGTGFIRAMAGGTGWTKENQFNRAWQARRQPGSAFKIFVYTTAVDSGFSPDSIVSDSPVSFPDGPGRSYSPRNSDGRYMGNISMRQAVMYSRNVSAVRMLHRIGPEKVIQYAYKMGIKDKLEPNLSLALGAGVVTPLDMTSAISVLANEGVRVEPTAIKKIVDSEGNVLEDNNYPSQEVVLPASTAYAMTDMLKGVVQSGTGTGAQIGRPAAGKTGTTDNFRDAWFVGYTPNLAAAVWTGNDDYTQMNYAFGGNIPATIWADFMKSALKDTKARDFKNPGSGLSAVLICDETGLLATSNCPKTHKEFFEKGKQPTRYCTLHGESTLKEGGDGDRKNKNEKEPGSEKVYKPEVFEEDILPPEDFSSKSGQSKPPEPEIIEEPLNIPAEQPPAEPVAPAPPPPSAPEKEVEL